jgi:(p)ppGpp synthase/HD superfamily hydrolase
MTPRERARFARALRFALSAHGDQKRKGTQIPYLSHLLQVAGLVLEHGGDADQAIAGLLHDAIEDCEGVNEAGLSERFGGEVARIVRAVSDVLEGDTPRRKSSWSLRKRRFIAHLRRQDERVRLVAGCDKLDNLRSLVADLHAEGPATLARFRGAPAQIRWYYEEVRRALGDGLPRRLLRELDALVAELGRFVPAEGGALRRSGRGPSAARRGAHAARRAGPRR